MGNDQLPDSPRITITTNPFITYLAFLYAGLRIVKAAFFPEEPIRGNVQTVIKQIHKQGFDPSQAYVYDGGHFPQIWVRNAGIFFNAFLDPRVILNEEDWKNRQVLLLKTLRTTLEMLRQTKKAYTTIFPVFNNYYTVKNVYTEASDALFGILYNARALSDEAFLTSLYPTKNPQHAAALLTKKETLTLLEMYKSDIAVAMKRYKSFAYNPETGLVKIAITLSSARDGIKRQSSFYDNVILWERYRLADSLNIVQTTEDEFEIWKQQIITRFWDEDTGIFIDDLSDESRKEKVFCGDSLIAFSTGFLKPDNEKDRNYLLKMITYIKNHGFDTPFPLRYSLKDTPEKLYWQVRLGAPSYMGKTIWSNWGMEYIKLLILLSNYNKHLLQDAEKHVLHYEKNIIRDGGYPEVYYKNGELYHARMYTSLLQNTWIVGYEQAKMLLENYKKTAAINQHS